MSTAAAHDMTRTPAFAIDIDGVVLRGGKPVPGSAEAIAMMEARGVPYVFVTNGSGNTEAVKAASLGKVLGMDIDPARIQNASTPMKALVDKHREEPVLFVGKEGAKDLGESYGFKHVMSSEEYHQRHPLLYPDIQVPYDYPVVPTDGAAPAEGNPAVGAVFVVADPIPWGRDLQILCDVLRSDGHPDTRLNKQQVPCYVSCCDFEYAGEYMHPRFGNGSFTYALEAVYEKTFGAPLEFTLYGKPYPVTFEYAQRTLQAQATELGKELGTIYMLGDNPTSDIAGANAMGAPWCSVLLRSGMPWHAQGQANDATHPGALVYDDMGEAVAAVLA